MSLLQSVKVGLLSSLLVSLFTAACGSADGRPPQRLPAASTAGFATNGFATNGFATNGFATNGFATNGFATNGFATNGFATNGFATNGFATNGFATNGLSPLFPGSNLLAINGLGAAGFASADFQAWFASAPDFTNAVMKYVTKCAVPAGGTLSYTDASGATYSWDGELGLAPRWAAGQVIPLDEQQLVSGCMAAHANKFGVHVVVSMRGYDETFAMIPIGEDEQATYDQDEGCFFGNLFDGTGVGAGYSSNSPLFTNSQVTSMRACAADAGAPGACAPLLNFGACQDLCHNDSSAEASTYFQFQTCQVYGVNYRAITTRLARSELNLCGDGICQASETCYDAATGSGCLADCGACH